MKNARAKRAKILFFIVKYANLWGSCCRRRRACLSSLVKTFRFVDDYDYDYEIYHLYLRAHAPNVTE